MNNLFFSEIWSFKRLYYNVVIFMLFRLFQIQAIIQYESVRSCCAGLPGRKYNSQMSPSHHSQYRSHQSQSIPSIRIGSTIPRCASVWFCVGIGVCHHSKSSSWTQLIATGKSLPPIGPSTERLLKGLSHAHDKTHPIADRKMSETIPSDVFLRRCGMSFVVCRRKPRSRIRPRHTVRS